MSNKNINITSLTWLQKVVTGRTKALVLILTTAVCLIFSGALNLQAEPRPVFHEYHVKAAFLYNFAKFVEWPEEAFRGPNDPITIGILGKDPFGSYLDRTIKNKTVKGRNLVVKRFEKANDLQACHILFISASEQKRLSQVLNKLNNWNVLTVSDIESFSRVGGMVNLIREGNKVRFEINVDAAKRAGLKISSHVLKLANIVRNDRVRKNR